MQAGGQGRCACPACRVFLIGSDCSIPGVFGMTHDNDGTRNPWIDRKRQDFDCELTGGPDRPRVSESELADGSFKPALPEDAAGRATIASRSSSLFLREHQGFLACREMGCRP